MEYLALGAGFTFGLFYLHLSQAIDWILVVILRRSSDVEALPEEELERLLVGRSDGAVQLPSTEVKSEVFGMLE